MALLQAVTLGLIALILAPGLLFYFDVTPKLAVLLAGTAILAPLAAVRPPRRAASLLVVLYGCSLAISASVSAHPGLSWFGSNWRRYGAVTQIAVLLFAWAVAAAPQPPHRPAGGRGGNRDCVFVRHSPVRGFRSAAARAAYHVGEGVWSIVRPPATFGYVSYFATWLAIAAFLSLALAAGEKARLAARATGNGRAGLRGAAAHRNACRRARTGRRRRGVALSRAASACRAALGLIAAIAVTVCAALLSLAGRIATALADPLVPGRSLGRRASLALAGLAPHGARATAAGLRPGGIHRGISALRIGRSGARLSGLRPRIATQHFSRRTDLARDRPDSSCCSRLPRRNARRIPRAPPRFCCRACRRPGEPAIYRLHHSHRDPHFPGRGACRRTRSGFPARGDGTSSHSPPPRSSCSTAPRASRWPTRRWRAPDITWRRAAFARRPMRTRSTPGCDFPAPRPTYGIRAHSPTLGARHGSGTPDRGCRAIRRRRTRLHRYCRRSLRRLVQPGADMPPRATMWPARNTRCAQPSRLIRAGSSRTGHWRNCSRSRGVRKRPEARPRWLCNSCR